MFKPLTSYEKIIRARYKLQKSFPFFAYLAMKLSIKKEPDDLPLGIGACINTKGDLSYSDEFIQSLDDNGVQFLLIHEVLHLALDHLQRLGNKNKLIFNVACDVIVNDIIINNNFTPIDGALYSSNFCFKFGNVTVKNTNEKTAEQIYSELPKIKKYNGFDLHSYAIDFNDSQKWKDNIVYASKYAKEVGDLPKGISKIIDNIESPRIGWRSLLQRYLLNTIPFDYSFSKFNKKIPDIILPGVVSESIDVIVHIDTSGSIDRKTFNYFATELVGIARSHPNMNITVINCDCEIHAVFKLNSYNYKNFLNMDLKGGGGTSHEPVWEYIKEKINNPRLLVSLTDGYSDIKIENKPSYDVIFALTDDGDENLPFGRIIKIR